MRHWGLGWHTQFDLSSGSVEHIISVNTVESGLSPTSGRGGGFRSGSMVVLRASWALHGSRK